MKLYLQNDIKRYFSYSQPLFEQIMALRGECFRQQKGRRTQRIYLGDKAYFIKQFMGVTLREILKNLLQLRLPVMSAKNEWLAIQKLEKLDVPVPPVIGYGERGHCPSKRQSFILMEALEPTVSLEELGKSWQTSPPSFAFKKSLIGEVARIARQLHQHGINHRDFYICHFLLDQTQTLKLYLIDLHRAQLRRKTPSRWIIKDLAGLYFSSKDIGLTQRDLYRFMKCYREKPLRDILKGENNFWKKVVLRGEKLFHDHK